jgi:DNA mismatch repair protein MSH5
VIGVVDKILSRIKSVDSVTSTLSSFASDSAQISFALRHATAHSLLLIDEYGKGTATNDGVALAARFVACFKSSCFKALTLCLSSIIRDFDRRGNACPKVLFATHFHGNGRSWGEMTLIVVFQCQSCSPID